MTERDYGAEAQRAAEDHLDACFEALEREETAEPGEEVDSPAVGAFCGCQTCCVRETLHASWPFLREAALAGIE